VTENEGQKRTIIVGGGVSGLAAAYELCQQSAPFTLLEARSRLGGLIRTEQAGGFVLDAGPDSLLVQKPGALDLCRDLGLTDRLISTLTPRTAYVLADRLHRLPANSVLGIPTSIAPWLTTGLISPLGKLRMALEPLVSPGGADDESVGAFFRRRLGEEVVERVAEPLLAGIHAGDVERLSLRALFPRLATAEQTMGSLIRAMRHARARTPPAPDGLFRSLPGGIEELVTALREALPAPSIRYNAQVSRIEGRAPFRVILADGEVLEAEALVLATPAYAVADMVRALDPELATLCAGVPYMSTATVLLAYSSSAVRRPKTGSGFVVPRVQRDTRLMAGSWVTSKWPGRAPPGQILVRGFLGGARDPNVLERDDDTLRAETHDTFARLLGIDRQPGLSRVYRWPRAMAQHEVGHLARVNTVERRLAGWPGLFLAGAGFRVSGIPDCITDGRTTAKAVLSWHGEQFTDN